MFNLYIYKNNISQYKYSSSDKSLIYKHFTSKIFLKIHAYTPNFIAPNLITLFGFFFILIPIIIFYFTGNFYKLFTALCIALYMIADALDGLQARSTGNASILGQLFDHTIDSIAVNLIMLYLIFALNIMHYHYYIIASTLLQFIGVALIEKYTGIFKLGYINGPTEGILFVMVSNIIGSFMQINIPHKYVFYAIILFNIFNIFELFKIFFKTARRVEYIIDLLYLITIVYLCNIISHNNIFIGCGLAILFCSALNLSILLSHIFSSPLYYIFDFSIFINIIHYGELIGIYFIYIIFKYVEYVVGIIMQLENILNISWWRIKK